VLLLDSLSTKKAQQSPLQTQRRRSLLDATRISRSDNMINIYINLFGSACRSYRCIIHISRCEVAVALVSGEWVQNFGCGNSAKRPPNRREATPTFLSEAGIMIGGGNYIVALSTLFLSYSRHHSHCCPLSCPTLSPQSPYTWPPELSRLDCLLRPDK
jgi:hypothetical protein